MRSRDIYVSKQIDTNYTACKEQATKLKTNGKFAKMVKTNLQRSTHRCGYLLILKATQLYKRHVNYFFLTKTLC